MSVHQNSIAAIETLKATGAITTRHKMILDVLANDSLQHLGRTDRMIMKALKFRDPNAVRPRVTELVKMGKLQECGKTKDLTTGMTVRRVRLTLPPVGSTMGLF